MNKSLKDVFRKGFTFLVVPNSPGVVRTISFPISVVLIVSGIILFNIYIFFSFSNQVFKIHIIQTRIAEKNKIIARYIKEIESLKKNQKPEIGKVFKNEFDQQIDSLERIKDLIKNMSTNIDDQKNRFKTNYSSNEVQLLSEVESSLDGFSNFINNKKDYLNRVSDLYEELKRKNIEIKSSDIEQLKETEIFLTANENHQKNELLKNITISFLIGILSSIIASLVLLFFQRKRIKTDKKIFNI